MKAKYELMDVEERESVKILDGEFDLCTNPNLQLNSDSMLTKASKLNSNNKNAYIPSSK